MPTAFSFSIPRHSFTSADVGIQLAVGCVRHARYLSPAHWLPSESLTSSSLQCHRLFLKPRSITITHIVAPPLNPTTKIHTNRDPPPLCRGPPSSEIWLGFTLKMLPHNPPKYKGFLLSTFKSYQLASPPPSSAGNLRARLNPVANFLPHSIELGGPSSPESPHPRIEFSACY